MPANFPSIFGNLDEVLEFKQTKTTELYHMDIITSGIAIACLMLINIGINTFLARKHSIANKQQKQESQINSTS